MENLNINGRSSVSASAQKKIFNHTEEELINMYTPLYEYEKNVSEITIKECGFGTIITTTKYRLHSAHILQNQIENLCSSEEEFEEMINTIGALIYNAYVSGIMAEKKSNGTFDDYVNAVAEYRIAEHNKQEAK